GTPEGRAFPAVEQTLGPQLEEDRLAEGAVFVGVRVVRVCEVRGHPDPDGELEETVPDRFDLLPALRDERFPVPAVERFPGPLLDRPLDVDPIPVEPEWEEDGTAEHALGPRDHVDHRIRHDRPDVPRAPRYGRRRPR